MWCLCWKPCLFEAMTNDLQQYMFIYKLIQFIDVIELITQSTWVYNLDNPRSKSFTVSYL